MLTTTLPCHRQPILADEVQTFKALITVHKVLQEGHPIAVKEAQANINWLESLTRGITGEGLRGMALTTREKETGHFQKEVKAQGLKGKSLTAKTGYGPLLRDYVYFLLAKLAFHRQHPEFNGLDFLQSARMIGAKKPCRTI